MAYKMKGFGGFGNSPAKQKKKGDKHGPIEKGSYPNIVENVSKVQKDKKGLYTTGLDDWDTHSVSDTTRYPKGFSDWKGEVKEGDYIDETTHEAWGGVDVESDPPAGEGQKATGKRKVYNKKTKKYEDYNSPAKQVANWDKNSMKAFEKFMKRREKVDLTRKQDGPPAVDKKEQKSRSREKFFNEIGGIMKRGKTNYKVKKAYDTLKPKKK